MDFNLYALERQVESKLAEARAEGARRALLAALRADRADILGAAGLALIRAGRRLNRRRGIRRRAARLALPSLP